MDREPAGSVTQEPPDTKVAFSIPVDSSGIAYEGLGDEEFAWGPTGLALGQDGTFWVADGVHNRVLRYSASGELIAVVDLKGIVTGIGDIAVNGEDLAVLDIASVPPVAHVVDGKTGVMDAVPVPIEFGLASGLSGVGYGPSGEILVELEGGARVGVLVDANGEATQSLVYGYPVADGIFAVEEPASDSEARSSAVVSLAETHIKITVDHTLGGIYLLQASGGTLSMLVEEATQDEAGVLRVDQTVRLYARDGDLLGVGRVPLAENSVYVSNGVAAGPDGRIWGLVTRADRVDVVEVVMQDEVALTLPLSTI